MSHGGLFSIVIRDRIQYVTVHYNTVLIVANHTIDNIYRIQLSRTEFNFPRIPIFYNSSIQKISSNSFLKCSNNFSRMHFQYLPNQGTPIPPRSNLLFQRPSSTTRFEIEVVVKPLSYALPSFSASLHNPAHGAKCLLDVALETARTLLITVREM